MVFHHLFSFFRETSAVISLEETLSKRGTCIHFNKFVLRRQITLSFRVDSD